MRPATADEVFQSILRLLSLATRFEGVLSEPQVKVPGLRARRSPTLAVADEFALRAAGIGVNSDELHSTTDRWAMPGLNAAWSGHARSVRIDATRLNQYLLC